MLLLFSSNWKKEHNVEKNQWKHIKNRLDRKFESVWQTNVTLPKEKRTEIIYIIFFSLDLWHAVCVHTTEMKKKKKKITSATIFYEKIILLGENGGYCFRCKSGIRTSASWNNRWQCSDSVVFTFVFRRLISSFLVIFFSQVTRKKKTKSFHTISVNLLFKLRTRRTDFFYSFCFHMGKWHADFCWLFYIFLKHQKSNTHEKETIFPQIYVANWFKSPRNFPKMSKASIFVTFKNHTKVKVKILSLPSQNLKNTHQHKKPNTNRISLHLFSQ